MTKHNKCSCIRIDCTKQRKRESFTKKIQDQSCHYNVMIPAVQFISRFLHYKASLKIKNNFDHIKKNINKMNKNHKSNTLLSLQSTFPYANISDYLYNHPDES